MGEEFYILFVKPQRDEENNTSLSEAFEVLSKEDYGFKPKWISPETCLTLKSKGKQVYIFDPFEGPAFDHMKELGYRIYGPRCILFSLQNKVELPKNSRRPVYTLAMKNVKVCCTSVNKVLRDDIMKKVHLMGGEMDCNLTADVTHLIAGEVGSNKYLVAADNGKVIMVKDWVDKVWEISQEKDVMATDDIFEKYRCPMFLGLTIVVSGFSSSVRSQMRNFVVRGGGKYSGELKLNECTHLIVKEAKGAKYEAAKNWKIRIIKDRWLYDCMDKGRYLDPQPYLFEQGNKNVKTSTPERLSVIGPHISDISAITNGPLNATMQRVDETTDMTLSRCGEQLNVTARNNGIAETKMGTTSMDMDTTVVPADVFLDDCKIFLSGLGPAREEKFRKIISAGGGLRSMELKGDVTHMVIGEVVASDILLLNQMMECPYVVSADWLMDCFHKNSHLDEEKYIRSDLGLKMPTRCKKTVDPGSKDIRDTEQPNRAKKKHEPKECSYGMNEEAASDLEMAELLSQYMNDEGVQPENNPAALEKESPVQECGAVDLESLTQDPNEICDAVDEQGLFSGKLFIILGFDEEGTSQLAEFVESKGGKIPPSGRKRLVFDIAIVPLLGFPVDVTVSEILTNAWLQMCIERDAYLPYDGHWLFRPLEVPENEPLSDCCISVSGYVGVERECIMHLAQALGAVCQNNFARRSNKTVQGSTHLIVNEPSGSKYTAAKKWSIPAVGTEWILACINSKKRVPEGDYDIEHLVLNQLEKSQNSVSRQSEDIQLDLKSASTGVEDKTRSSSSSSTASKSTSVSTANDSVFVHKSDKICGGSRGNTEITQLETDNKGRTVDVTKKRSDELIEGPIPTSSAESNEPNNKNVIEFNPMAEVMRKHPGTTPVTGDYLSSERTPARKTACRPNQSENINAGGMKTPLTMQKEKWGQLAHADSPTSSSTPVGLTKGGAETPGTFMHPDFRPKFNLEGSFNTSDNRADLNKSTPLGEVFARQITRAAQNASAQNAAGTDEDGEMPASQSVPDQQGPLHGVVIAVAKKLGRSHEQYNSIVLSLGGGYSWHNGQQVTHFVFQGRTNDPNKEFRKARDDGKLIVSPHWLYACKEQNCRVEESLFPYNYNPNFTLTMTSASRATPMRSTRAAARNKGQEDAVTKATGLACSKTPSRKMPVLNLQQAEKGNSHADCHPVLPQEVSSDPHVTEQETSPGILHAVASRGAVADVTPTVHEKTSPKEQQMLKCTPVAEHTATHDKELSGRREEASDKSKSQEIKAALTKTLGNVLEGAARSKRPVKRKGKRLNLSGQLNASDGGNISDHGLGRPGSSAWISRDPKPDANLREPSQSIQVTWDDPTGRLEEEKLAHRLARVCEPSQNTDELLAVMEIPETKTAKSSPWTNARSPTPEPPSIAFPVARSAREVMSPQPVELLSEESSDSRMESSSHSLPAFLVSGMSNEERVDYSALVEQLGGKMLEKQHFDPSCTHLVVGQPTRNEKFLSCVASGKWVLHKSYFEACRKEGKFVKEETHEWGSDYTLPLMQNMTTQANKLASAAHKWRKKMSSLKKSNPLCKGVFKDWNVLLCLDRAKEDNFKRLLEAGGAQVSAIRSPFPKDVSGTHAFLDLNKIKIEQVDLELLIEADIHCLKAEFIPAYLTDDPQPHPSEFYPPEVVALLACMPEVNRNRKRHLTRDSTHTAASKAPKR